MCINENITKKIIFPQISRKECPIIDCSNVWRLKRKKLIANTNTCIESCNKSLQYKYEYNGKCYEKCIYYYYIENENNYYCTINSTCPDEYSYLINNECSKYYFENEIKDTTKIEGKKTQIILKEEETEYYNNILPEKNSKDEETEYYNNILPEKNSKNEETEYYNNILPEKNSKDEETELYSYILPENISKEEEIKYYDNFLQIIEERFTSENYDTSNLDKGVDKIIKNEKMIIVFTTSQNQKKNINNNMSSIDLRECETLLRDHYNIPKDQTLYMRKIDVVQEGMKTQKVEFDVYSKLSGKNLVKLNLTICRTTKISIFIPIIITDNLDKFNASSGYYNDICYVTTSEDGTDISLKDRQIEYFEKDKMVCQEDCDFTQYDYETCKAKCSCDVKETPSSIVDMYINKAKLLDNFKDIKNIMNYKFLVCYEKLLKKEGILNNIGCYILLVIILFFIISIFIFYISQYSSLKKRIKNIRFGIYKYYLGKESKNQIKQVKKFGIKTVQKIQIKNDIEIKKINRIQINKGNKKEKIFEPKNEKKLEKNTIFIHKKGKIKNIFKKRNANKKFIPKYYSKEKLINPKINVKSVQKEEKIKSLKNISKIIDEEINALSYKLALQHDKRTYFDYYISLLKTKHNLIFTLCNHTDYNSGIIKLDLFFIGFTIEYVVNALFYNDETMHKIYESKGQFDLLSQLPIIIYSYLISSILNTPLNYLALSSDTILNFKQYKSMNNIMIRENNLIRILDIKFLYFFIISFLFLIFFWYYLSLFGVIYKNTQVHLLKDTLVSFGLSLIVPFIIYLIPGIFRIPSLYNTKRKCLFGVSQFLQSF